MNELHLANETEHEIQPVKDSWYTQLGKPANLLNPFDYPIEAVCKTCSKPIVAKSLIADWVHFSRDQVRFLP